jgi:hypothetical protein
MRLMAFNQLLSNRSKLHRQRRAAALSFPSANKNTGIEAGRKPAGNARTM